jgi:hypothetical protein
LKRERLDDLLLHRYSNIEYVYRQPIGRAVKLVLTAIEEERKIMLYQQWLMLLTKMTDESFVSFEDFYEKAKPKQIDMRPKEEIMNEILRGEG